MIAECRHCGEPFEHWTESTKGWGPREPVDIVCPHCGVANGQTVTIGYVHARPLRADERDAYWRSKRSPTDFV